MLKKTKKPKKGQNKKLGFVLNFHLLRSIYIPNFRRFHQTIPRIICGRQTNEWTNNCESIGIVGTPPPLLKGGGGAGNFWGA